VNTLSAAVIGLGIGKQHVRVLHEMQGVELVAVADLKDEAVAEVAAQLPAHTYHSGAELLDKEQLDFVCVCTPPRSHLALTQQAASRGAHVFCEKPMAPTLADCDAMIAACKQHGVKLMIGQKKRFHPFFQWVKQKTAAELGPIRWACVRYACGRVPMPWFWHEQDGGGPLLENSVHAMDLLRFLVGDVARVCAEGANLFNEQWAPQLDAAAVTLRFCNGAIASVACGQTWEWGFGGENTVLATEGAVIEVAGPFDGPDRLRYATRQRPDHVVEVPPEPADLFALELAHFGDCIRTGAEPMVTGESARASTAVCLAVKESARAGPPVAIAPQGSPPAR